MGEREQAPATPGGSPSPPVPARLALAAVAASAVLYASSFPPFSLWWLAWIALAPWLAVTARESPARAAGLGVLWSIVVACIVAAPLPGLLARYLEVGVGVAWLGSVAIAATMFAPYFAAFAAWLAWSARRGSAGPFVAAAGWMACELARGRLVAGNPWALAGVSQAASAYAPQAVDIVGVYGLGGLIALANAVLAGLVTPRLRGRRPASHAGLALGLVAASWAYGAVRLRQAPADVGASAPAGESPASAPRSPSEPSEAPTRLTVAIVQPATERGASWRPEYRQHGLAANLALTETVRERRPDLVVWPEFAVSFYPEEASAESASLLAASRGSGFDILLGAPHYEFRNGATIYHNSAYLVREGAIAERYDKRRLVPVAEAPAAGLRDERAVRYAPGADAGPLTSNQARLGTSICFEAMYPELVNESAARGADVLVNLSNDSWMGSPAPARQHFDMARLRAIENRRWLIRAATTGISAVVDPEGRVVGELPVGQAGVLMASVAPRHETTPYQLWGDAPVLMLSLAGLAASLRRRPAALPQRRTESEPF